MSDIILQMKIKEENSNLFKRCIRKLLASTFILRDKDEKMYAFASRESNRQDISEYLRMIGFDVMVEEKSGVCMLTASEEDEETVGLKRANVVTFTTVQYHLLLVLWKTYLENLGYNEGNFITKGDLIDKIMSYGDIAGKQELSVAFRLFKKYSLINYDENEDGEDMLIQLYPSLQFGWDIPQFEAVSVNMLRMKARIGTLILLEKVRLLNWYAFSNETAPVGQFTLIAGKNGNGKSVLLDAVKYAAYGDTVFNKSSESKGSRTLSSYTRGLLDATAGTYMRPADRFPTVYTHIALEYFDELSDKHFILGAVIETSAANNCQTLRYVMNDRKLDDVSHTYEDNGTVRPYSSSGLQKAYGLILMNREQGLPKFLQMTGMKMGLSQLPAYLRRLRGIMSYDPDARAPLHQRERPGREKR